MLSMTTTTLGRCVGTLALGLAVVVGPMATESGAASDVTSSSQLAPDLVTGGRTAFYSATWQNDGLPTLTNVVAVITLPAGSAVLSATPATCTSASTGGTDPVVVSCPGANLRSGASLTQQLLVQTPTVAASTSATVTAVLRADEKGSDTERAHTDTFPAPDRSFTLVPGTADAAGGCLRDGDPALQTRSDLGATNPLITAARLAGSSGQLCVPLTVRERAASSPTEACGARATCTTDIATTEYIPVTSQPLASPVQLTFTVVATNKNMTWYKAVPGQPGVAVQDCLGASALPTGVPACVNSRSKPTSMSVRLGVLWQAGPDPTWRG
jgi:hypothetical protein